MIQNLLSKNYSSALLELAIEQNAVAKYRQEIFALKKLLNENPDYLTLLKSDNLDVNQRMDLFSKAIGNDVEEYISNFILLLIKKNKVNYIEDVLQDFFVASGDYLKIKEGIVYSTVRLSEEELEEISIQASKETNLTVHLTNVIDNKVMGGFKIQIEDIVIDYSIYRRMRRLLEQVSKKSTLAINQQQAKEE